MDEEACDKAWEDYFLKHPSRPKQSASPNLHEFLLELAGEVKACPSSHVVSEREERARDRAEACNEAVSTGTTTLNSKFRPAGMQEAAVTCSHHDMLSLCPQIKKLRSSPELLQFNGLRPPRPTRTSKRCCSTLSSSFGPPSTPATSISGLAESYTSVLRLRLSRTSGGLVRRRKAASARPTACRTSSIRCASRTATLLGATQSLTGSARRCSYGMALGSVTAYERPRSATTCARMRS